MAISDEVFSTIDAHVGARWTAVPLKAVIAFFILGFLVEFTRFWTIRFWSRVSARIERRQWFSGAIGSARKIGVGVGAPGWRKRMPRSLGSLEGKTPARLFHYMRARRLTGQISSRRLERMATRRNRLEMLSELPMRVVRVFARRSVVVLSSCAVVYDHERPGELRGDLGRIAERSVSLADQRTWIPVLVLGVGVLAVSRASPLIDGVRARDEAAKDTNRMLTELLAKLSELDVALREVYGNITVYRRAYLDEISGVTKSGREWSPQSGFDEVYYGFRADWLYGKSLDALVGEGDFQRMRQALDSVGSHLEGIRDKGLSSVAIRILAPVSSVLRDCGLEWHLLYDRNHDLGVTRSYVGMGWLEMRAEAKERVFTRFMEGSEEEHVLDSRLLEESYRVDDLLLRGKLGHLRLRRVQRFLIKRVHGTMLTRLIGAARG